MLIIPKIACLGELLCAVDINIGVNNTIDLNIEFFNVIAILQGGILISILIMKLAAYHFAYVKNYGLIGIALLFSWLISLGTAIFLNSNFFSHTEYLEIIPIFLNIIIIFALGFVAYELSRPTIIPSFIIAIFFGFVSQNILSYITINPIALSVLITIGASLILFGGGLGIPFKRFRYLLGPIISLAFLGTVITALIFSLLLGVVTSQLNIAIPISAIILIGIALASTDPAAIIPSFKSLLFNQPRVGHIAISESALNDVIGALITGIFLALFAGNYIPASILETYKTLLTLDNVFEIIKIITIGSAAGIAGYFILDTWSKWKERIVSEGEADSALFLAVPLLTFTLAVAFGGNGFLAVFVAGLLFQLRSHVGHVEHFFNHTIEGFMKPLIFMLLGALINFEFLLEFAVLGIIMGILFMLVIRPIAVFISLSPFMKGKHMLTLKELIFLSFVRETGVMPAVLLVSIKVAGIPGSDIALAVGMWVILLTLIVQPPLTPFLAKFLGIARDLPPFPKQNEKSPTVVLVSRSYTFLERIDRVVDWALKHHVENVLLLHCPEDKYSENFLKEVFEVAQVRFKSINNRLAGENKKELNFKFIGRPGTLEDNIEALIAQGDIAIIFVGSKMLDYRLEKVKQLQTPFMFM